MVSYLDQLDAGGVPPDRRILAALGPRALRLAAERTLGTHPYLTVPDHTRAARQLLGPGAVIAPEHKVVLDTDPGRARATGRAFVSDPYLKLSNYTTNLRRHGYTDADIDDGGSDRLIDALVLHGSPDIIAAGLRSHLDAGGRTTSRSRSSPAPATTPYRPTGTSPACCYDLPPKGRPCANAVRRQPRPGRLGGAKTPAADGGKSPVPASGSGAGHAFSRPSRCASHHSQPSASTGRTSARVPAPGSRRLARSTPSVHLSGGHPRRTTAAPNGRVRAPAASSALTVRARDAHRALPERRHPVPPQDRHITRSLTPVLSAYLSGHGSMINGNVLS